MSYLQTPSKPLPGAYIQTPAASRTQPSSLSQPFSRAPSTTSQQRNDVQTSSVATTQQLQSSQASGKPVPNILHPIERAAKTINEKLEQDLKYPELDTCIGQGISSIYDIHSQPSWAPFQKVKLYQIPDKIFEQYNRAQVSTMMGLFADLSHAWVTIDNACYLWDYTHPNPNLVGFEEQPNTITAVKLVTPSPGVFQPVITRLLVIATTAEIILVGLSCVAVPGGGYTLSLFKTGMSVPSKGIDVNIIEGSPANGRVFFCGRDDNDVYELTYQQEEKWFQSRCTRINHTSKGFTLLTPSFSFSQKSPKEYTVQVAIDDSRKLLYTLSSLSTIRVFHMISTSGLNLVITKPLHQILDNIGHMTIQTHLITACTQFVSMCPISAREASKLHLMVVTQSGCRVFMSATTSYGSAITNGSTAPTTMQVQHVKFPPPEISDPSSMQPVTHQGINNTSKSLITTRNAIRYPPGFFFCFVSQQSQAKNDVLFVSAPDTGRIAHPQELASHLKYPELGFWLNLGSRAEDVGLASTPMSASSFPVGFANELAVQFDNPTADVAILTNTGIHTLRRRRPVDIFAAAIRIRGGSEGLAAEIQKFIKLYGRDETAATALAVACGQGLDVTQDSRVASVLDPELLERARTAFIEFGGKPFLSENSLVDQTDPTLNMVRHSSRHEGLAIYMARLIRSIWRSPIAQELTSPVGGLTVLPTVSLAKLREIQQDVTKVKEFLNANKSFIEGLTGPEALGRVSTKQEEVALQAEHRALHSLIVLGSNIIEGISFVLVLFEERIEETVLLLANDSRQRFKSLTFEGLFCSLNGKQLAKELVKAIVNRNIANGSNVDTVADTLRRRCGSFCTADDVMIFKAQEQLKRATEATSVELGRNLLNESLKLFAQVAHSLSMEQLQWAVEHYNSTQFFAGAIQLALSVAQDLDGGNQALTWIQEGRPESDPRAAIFEARKRCYALVHNVISSLDQSANQYPDVVDGQYTLASKRRSEAYSVIDTSKDEVFHTDLYDWYVAQGQAERLLSIQSPYIIAYLERKATEDIFHANLLWNYHTRAGRPHDAATIQIELAKSMFPLPLDKRIEYLSQAKANASTYTSGVGRQSRQTLLKDISDRLDVANIQDDLLQRLRGETRIPQDRRQEIVKILDDQIIGLSELYNTYADQAGYHDICILIYQAADHRNPSDIKATWKHLLETTHSDAVDGGKTLPYEAVANIVRTLGTRLHLSEFTFPIPDLLPLLERYAFEHQRGVGPVNWVLDVFLDLHIPCESLFAVLEMMLYNDEAPFHGPSRKYLAPGLLYLAQRWYHDTSRDNGFLFGSDENATRVSHALEMMLQTGISAEKAEECQILRRKIAQTLE